MVALALTGFTWGVSAQFVAINEEVRGANTSINVTTNDVRTGSPTSGLLKNITNGVNTSVTLTLTNFAAGSANLTPGAPSGVPRDASPASNVFGAYVTFGNGFIQLGTNQVLAHVLTGLDPNSLYSLKGTTIKGTATAATLDRWTVFELLSGSTTFTNAHSPGCITNGLGGIVMANNEVAICTGDNREGRIFDWEGVRPTTDGVIVIYSRKFYNVKSIPGVITNNFTTPGYGLEVLRVQEFPASGCSAARVSDDPNSITNWLRAPTSFTVVGGGTPPLFYQWYKSTTPTGASNAIANATNATYTIASNTLADIGYYMAVVTNACGKDSSVRASLTLWTNPPVLLSGATNVTLSVGNGTSFYVTAYGSSPLYGQWYKDGVAIAGASDIAGSSPPAVVTNAFVLAVTNVDYSDAGFYACVVTNRLGTISNGARLVVTEQPPLILQQPADLVVGRDDPATLTVVATGGNLVYRWYKATTPTGASNIILGASGTNLTFSPSYLTNSGYYSVVVSNSAGRAYSRVARLLVSAAPPVITVQPTNLTVVAGTSVTLSVTATGAPVMLYQWFKDGDPIVGATASNNTIASVLSSNAGVYSVRITNRFGFALSSNANLTVTYTPVTITSQPQDVSVAQGMNASFTVGASGSLLSYQWYFIDALIANATNATLNLNNATVAQSGYYQAMVYNFASTNWSRSALLGVARPPVSPIDTNTLWSYNDTGANLGTNWYALSYPPATNWPQGPGTLGFKGNVDTVDADLPAGYPFRTYLHRTNNNTAGLSITNAYFRAAFNYDSNLMGPGMTITVSNIVDDGAVVYLNGREVWRIGMPTGTPDYMTFANRTVGSPKVWESFTVPVSQLLPGTNVLAAEVHQINSTSTDLDWMSILTINYASPNVLTITNQPDSAVTPEGQTATFEVGVSTPAQYMWAEYQWYKVVNGASEPIPGATANILSVPTTVQGAEDGFYFVTVSNPVSFVVSAVASLQVVHDGNPPALLDADGSYDIARYREFNPTNVYITFAEPVTPETATNAANYLVRDAGNAPLTVTKAFQMSPSNVLIQTSTARKGNTNYYLVVSNLTDISPHHNVVTNNNAIPISRYVNLINWSMDAARAGRAERFDAYVSVGWIEPGLASYDVGNDWLNPNWVTNVGMLYNVPSGFGMFQGTLNYPGLNGNINQINTLINQGPCYYRKWFVNNCSPSGMTVEMGHYVDAGALFYLNGVEIARYNVGDGTNALNIYYPAPIDIDENNVREVDLTLPQSVLKPGTNFLAVMHKSHTWSASTDYPPGYYRELEQYFDMTMRVRTHGFANGPLLIVQNPVSQTVNEGDSATFSVGALGASYFKWRVNGNTNYPSSTNGTFTLDRVSSSLSNALIDVLVANNANFTGAVTSAPATLTVLRDITGPSLVSAYASAVSPQITVSYSEPVQLSSATTLANYAVTNSSGPANNLTVTGASLVNQTNVVLTVAAYKPGAWFVVVNNVRDASAATNRIAPNSVVQVGLLATSVLSIENTNQLWSYNQQGVELATNWTAWAYDDSTWPTGLAALDAKGASGILNPRDTLGGVNIRTHLTLYTPGSTNNQLSASYFRTKFNLAVPLWGATLNLEHFIDDGAVFYLNGSELGRYGMAAGAVNYGTLANITVGDASLQGPLLATVPTLWTTNVFAAEVHQINLTSSDLSFGVNVTMSKESRSFIFGESTPATVVTLPANPVGSVTATLNGSINPNGFSPTRVWFEFGQTNSYDNTILLARGMTGLTVSNISLAISNLAMKTTYNYRLVASNNFGVIRSDPIVFTTAVPPTVTTLPADSVAFVSVRLNGQITMAGAGLVTTWFEYSVGASTWLSTPVAIDLAPGTTNVSALVTGLAPNTAYTCRIVASNAVGMARGSAVAFTTLQMPVLYGPTKVQNKWGWRFAGPTNFTYEVYGTTNNVTTPSSNWTYIGNAYQSPANSSNYQWRDTQPATARMKFYQLRPK